MIRVIAGVIRGEGLHSAIRRARERVAEASREVVLRVRSAGSEDASILNVCSTRAVPRLGGMQIQLRTRLEAERALRKVALLHGGTLELATHARRIEGDFLESIQRAIDITGAKAVHLEGTDGVDVGALLRIARSTRLILSLHDLSLTSREVLEAASGVIFPSWFLREHYRCGGAVIEPGVDGARGEGGRAVAYAGSVKPNKGGRLLPRILPPGAHVFGGGDEDLLRELRNVHGYYRAGELPSLLARHRVGLVVLPSIVPEAFSLVLSEAWLAGAAVAAFDHGAIAERIRAHGGGWLAPPGSGAEGLAKIVDAWIAGELRTEVPKVIPTPRDAARAMVEQYRAWGLHPGA